jgi:hypothetical protein
MSIVEFKKISNKRKKNKDGNYGFKACSTTQKLGVPTSNWGGRKSHS